MPKVTLKTNGSSAQANDGDGLMDVAKNNGWPIPFGCEDGVCGTCICRVASGEENLSKMEEKEQMTLEAMGLDDGGYILCCQRTVQGGDVELEQ